MTDLVATSTEIQLSETSYLPPVQYTYADWVADGQRFSRLGKSLLWWIGDWSLYGMDAFGEEFYQGVSDSGYEPETITDAQRVCQAWPQEKRCANLSYNHHRVLVAVPEDQRDRWVDDAVAYGWSVRDLRKELNRVRQQKAMLVLAQTDQQQIMLATPPYGENGIKDLPDLPLADDSMLLLQCWPSHVQRGIEQSVARGYRIVTSLIGPRIGPSEPRHGIWATAEASIVLMGVRGDLTPPLEDEQPSQFVASLFDLAEQLDRAYPTLSKGVAWSDLNHPAFSYLTPDDSQVV